MAKYFPQIEWHQIIDSKIITNPKQDTNEENHTGARHNKSAEKQRQKNNLKSIQISEISSLFFTAELFTVSKRWKQYKCPLMDE